MWSSSFFRRCYWCNKYHLLASTRLRKMLCDDLFRWWPKWRRKSGIALVVFDVKLIFIVNFNGGKNKWLLYAWWECIWKVDELVSYPFQVHVQMDCLLSWHCTKCPPCYFKFRHIFKNNWNHSYYSTWFFRRSMKWLCWWSVKSALYWWSVKSVRIVCICFLNVEMISFLEDTTWRRYNF